jgi:hypothetical protein
MGRKLLLSLAAGAMARAQYAPAPESYTVIQHNSLFGADSVLQYYRDGPKAVVDLNQSKGAHVRTVYDLAKHTTVTWDAADPKAECGNGSFSGDWGDPFKGSASMMDDLGKQHPIEVGTETVNGVSTKVLDAAVEGASGKARIWIDAKYGMIMRLKLPEADGTSKIAFETTQVTIGKPAASAFVPACKAAPAMPTDEDKIVALTGGPASDFAYANHGSPTGGGCLVYFRVVRAGSMTPVTSGYEVFVDGKPVPVQNGLARIIGAPKEFSVDVRVPSGGATAPISRQCSAPQTTLLLVAKNWDQLGEGADWLWVKSGKFAGH